MLNQFTGDAQCDFTAKKSRPRLLFSKGEEWPLNQCLVAAALYVEDGSGRSICYYRSLLRTGAASTMRGYIGFDPNPQSVSFRTELERESARNATRYSTLENILNAINVKLVD